MHKSVVFSIASLISVSLFCPPANCQWKAMKGAENTVILTFAPHGPYLLAAATVGAYRSQDEGQNWIAIDSGLVRPPEWPVGVYSFAAVGSNLFAGTTYGVFVSYDSGMTWQATSSGLPYNHVNSILAVGSTLIAAANSGDLYSHHSGIYLSTNNGSTWTPADSSTPIYYNINCLAKLGSTIFAGIWGGGVYLSKDSGMTWVYSLGSGNGAPVDFAVSDSTILAADYDGAALLSSDTGGTWAVTYIDSPVSSVRSVAMSGSNLFAGTTLWGVFASTDNGTSWVSKNEGLGSYPSSTLEIRSLFVIDGYLFAGTGTGIWRRPVSELLTVVNGSTPNTPEGYTLGQNYPNPFNPSTSIGFHIPSTDITTLKIYDVLGREIATLVSHTLRAGTYTFAWNASTFPSGVYLYRLSSGQFTATRKLVVVK